MNANNLLQAFRQKGLRRASGLNTYSKKSRVKKRINTCVTYASALRKGGAGVVKGPLGARGNPSLGITICTTQISSDSREGKEKETGSGRRGED